MTSCMCALGRDDQPDVARIVGVRREQRGPARAERAVGEHFDGAHPQLSVVGFVDDSVVQLRSMSAASSQSIA